MNTELQMIRKGSKASFIDVKSGGKYELDVGAEGDLYLEKFVSKKRIPLDRYPKDVNANIQNAVARVGMTKEQVYIAMGPPTVAGSERTKQLTYDQIMLGDLWVYARRRFSKNIGISFDPATGKVNRTEAMLR